MKSYSAYQFTLFRMILGSYLFIHFLILIPYAAEIWSHAGMLPDPSVNLTYGYFPNLLLYLNSPLSVKLYVIFMAVLSFGLLIGFQRPIISVLLWYGWASLFDRNNLILNPGIPYIGWILLCCAAIPKGEPWSITKSTNKWEMPVILYYGAWALMAIGYSISGFDKFSAPSWKDGSAIFHLLENPLARDSWLREFFAGLPMFFSKIATWLVLFLEICFLPLALFKPTRKWIWLALVLLHIGILLIIDFTDLTLGMLMIHWFTFDASWLKAKPKRSGILYFDGVCVMCNHFAKFLISEDKNDALQFASLQGDSAKYNIDAKHLNNINTLIYQEGEKTYSQSSGILQAIASLGGIYKLVLVLKLTPKFIRDKIYVHISANRYKWFGKYDVCRVPRFEEKSKLLP